VNEISVRTAFGRDEIIVISATVVCCRMDGDWQCHHHQECRRRVQASFEMPDFVQRNQKHT
jgi:hypothetical protein